MGVIPRQVEAFIGRLQRTIEDDQIAEDLVERRVWLSKREWDDERGEAQFEKELRGGF